MRIQHKLYLPTAQEVLKINKLICERDGNRFQCYGIGKVESALSSASYPGDPPFQHGGIVKVAGALCYYITQAHAFFDGNKRTALIISSNMLELNGWYLRYPLTTTSNALSNLIEACADSKVSKEDMMQWFDTHKVQLK